MLRTIINFFKRLFGINPPVKYGELTGTVTAASGQPVRQAAISFTGFSPTGRYVHLSARTSSFGAYQLRIPLDCPYTLEAKAKRHSFGPARAFDAGYLGPIDFVAKATDITT